MVFGLTQKEMLNPMLNNFYYWSQYLIYNLYIDLYYGEEAKNFYKHSKIPFEDAKYFFIYLHKTILQVLLQLLH